MNLKELTGVFDREIDAFPCKTALLLANIDTAEVYYARGAETPVVSASTIKVPILLAALEEVREGRLSLDTAVPMAEADILPDSRVFELGAQDYSLWELLYWMIVRSDNSATNRVLDLIGFDRVNRYANETLGLSSTVCQRKMLDFDAVAAGRNNFTSAADQFGLYRLLCTGKLLTPALTETALDMLRRQRSTDAMLRYIPDPVMLAHKGGCLDYLEHDAGVFSLPGGPLFLGVFTWDGPSPEGDPRQRQLVGRLSKAAFDWGKSRSGCTFWKESTKEL